MEDKKWYEMEAYSYGPTNGDPEKLWDPPRIFVNAIVSMTLVMEAETISRSWNRTRLSGHIWQPYNALVISCAIGVFSSACMILASATGWSKDLMDFLIYSPYWLGFGFYAHAVGLRFQASFPSHWIWPRLCHGLVILLGLTTAAWVPCMTYFNGLLTKEQIWTIYSITNYTLNAAYAVMFAMSIRFVYTIIDHQTHDESVLNKVICTIQHKAFFIFLFEVAFSIFANTAYASYDYETYMIGYLAVNILDAINHRCFLVLCEMMVKQVRQDLNGDADTVPDSVVSVTDSQFQRPGVPFKYSKKLRRNIPNSTAISDME